MALVQINGGTRTKPTEYPLPMGRHGKNPFGENLWRIVYAASVMEMIGGRWPDGREEYRWVPKYDEPNIRTKWILEKWRSGWEITKCSPEVYDYTYKAPGSELLINGPYPHRGDYEAVHVFDASVPADGGIDWLIGNANQAHNTTLNQKRLVRQEAYQKEEKDKKQRNMDRIMDLLPNPNGATFLKHQKSTVFRSANQLGLPTEGGMGVMQQ